MFLIFQMWGNIKVDKLDEFRNTLKLRLRLAMLYNAVMIVFMGTGNYLHEQFNAPDFAIGFAIGIFIGLEFLIVTFMVRWRAALKDDTKLKAIYIKENDERKQYIMTKIGSTGLNLVVGGLVLGALFSCFINMTVFTTLVCTLLATNLIKMALKLYYFHSV